MLRVSRLFAVAILLVFTRPSTADTDREHALTTLDVRKGLEVTLFAAEPILLSPTNIDIDHRGRIWVCEVVNYRSERRGDKFPFREAGDCILILEDTNGNGEADSRKVFYQSREIDSAHGICVLPTPSGKNTKAIVSAGANIFVLTDSDGDDQADRKDVLFTNIDGVQHDHGIHAVVIGPDGKLYFNFGNMGKRIQNKNGESIIDSAGNTVESSGQPYWEGMVFRCNMDGSEFETLGWNFRNNWEVCVDSYGTIWQSDNDDDGNRGVRINYVMEFGNYGYRDERTGAGWKTPRTGMADDIPTRHWHQNDPGVIPNLLYTGQGSPTGICIYEGSLLQHMFHNQLLHCDAGPNVMRAYSVRKTGAGYEGGMQDVLVGTRDKWFRPTDVCVAPDGSLFVADWYDAAVGGHAMVDADRGRIYRVAPSGHDYTAPTFDFGTVDGAISALRSGNATVRYMARTALHGMRKKAEPALWKMFVNSTDPRHRARALWLLGKMSDRCRSYVEAAIGDPEPNIRIVGLRLARQSDIKITAIVADLVDDESSAVRRECAIALRHCKEDDSAPLWAKLADRHDGQDRWYLEALGIGADKQWDRFLAVWLNVSNLDMNSPAARDILWRSRAKQTPKLLAKIILDSSTTIDELPRFFRAFDFQQGQMKNEALVDLAVATSSDAERQRFLWIETWKRISEFNPKILREDLNRALDELEGSSLFVTLVGKYHVAPRFPQLLAMAQRDPESQVGIEAIRMLLSKEQLDLISVALTDKDVQTATATARALGNSADGRATDLLLPIVEKEHWDLELRRQATRAVAKTANGARALITLAQANQLDHRLKASASFLLNASPLADVRAAAANLYPLPAAKNSKLPPIAELLKKKGDPTQGASVFSKSAECAKCHQVNGIGKDIGPDLSEIGSKLSRQALYESILYPSAGISHNYETYQLALDNGNIVNGILISQDRETVTLKLNDGIARTFQQKEIEEMTKSDISLMPADLQKTMSMQDLVEVVEYLMTLKKAQQK